MKRILVLFSVLFFYLFIGSGNSYGACVPSGTNGCVSGLAGNNCCTPGATCQVQSNGENWCVDSGSACIARDGNGCTNVVGGGNNCCTSGDVCRVNGGQTQCFAPPPSTCISRGGNGCTNSVTGTNNCCTSGDVCRVNGGQTQCFAPPPSTCVARDSTISCTNSVTGTNNCCVSGDVCRVSGSQAKCFSSDSSGGGREGGFDNNGPSDGGSSITIPGLNSLGIAGIPTGGVGKLNSVLGVAVAVLFVLSILLCLFYIIWGAYFWITSEGDKQKLHQARERIVFALIGLTVVFLAYAIIGVITNFFFARCLVSGGIYVPC